MKRLTLFWFMTTLIFSGCVKEPYADFTASNTQVAVGDIIYFTNRSYDAGSYEWDFGDGYFSNNFNVSHFYEYPGLYNVQLSAFGKDSRTSRAFMEIRVLSTDLEITVQEWNDKYPVGNASVILYPSLEDWRNETNKISEGFTCTSGKVLFTNLVANRIYYVDVWETNHDNYTLAAEDAGFITTDRLVAGAVNYFTAWVDYYLPEKKNAIDRRNKKEYILQNHAPESVRIKGLKK